MKFRMKAAVAGMLTAGVLAATMGAAFAATPPWYPDTSSRGSLTLFDGAGNVITTGDTTNLPVYAETNGNVRSGDNLATLQGAIAQQNTQAALWSADQMSGGNNFPIAGAPGSIGTSPTRGVYKVTPGDETLAQLAAAHPHPAADTGTPYEGVYQIRIITSSPANGVDPLYWGTDIKIVGTTWTQVYPAPVAQATTTTLTVTPASPQNAGTNLTLTAAITPSGAAGSVQFQSDGTNLGATVTVVAGSAQTTTNSLAVGTHSLTAIFTPSNPANFAGSNSNAVSYTINTAPATQTQTGLAIDPGSSTAYQPVTFTATVTPSAAPGTVSFSETGTVIGTTPAGSGTFVFTTSALGQGTHNIVATFNPTNSANFTSSSSAAVPVTLGAPAFAPDQQTIIVNVPAGTLSIHTDYTSSNPLNLHTMVLNAAGTQFSATATFQNIAISDTRAGALPITAKAQSSDLTGAGTINSQNVGLTNLVPTYTPGNGIDPGATPPNPAVTFSNPAANPAVGPTAAGSQGLGGPSAHTIVTVAHGPGAFSMDGTLTLNAPSSTPAGNYTGTITFTIG